MRIRGLSVLTSLPGLVALNLALLAAAVAAGWLVSSWTGAEAAPGIVRAAHGTDRFRADAVYILTMNLRVVGMLVLGGCTMGLLTLAQLTWLGYSLGYGLSGLSRGAGSTIPLVLGYVPFEFLAFVLAASATLKAVLMVVQCLVFRTTPRPRGALALLAAALLLLAVAAALEAWVTPLVGLVVLP